jgi:uncharacterized protein
MIDKTGCVGNTIITSSKTYFDLENPRPEDVNIFDIAWSLAKECRYTGQIGHDDRQYSVAEHCLRCVWYAHKELRVDGEVLRAVLLHDASEAYTGDINKPLKNLLRQHTDALEIIERNIDRAIATRFGCDFEGNHDAIKLADHFMMFTEKRYFFGSGEPEWSNESGFNYIPGHDPRCLGPELAAKGFLSWADRLGIR